MPRAYERYTRSLHGAALVAFCAAAAAGCDSSEAASSNAHAESEGRAGSASAAEAKLAEVTAKLAEATAKLAEAAAKLADNGAPRSVDAGAAPLEPPQSDCGALSCIGNGAQLADYCDEPFARCPATFAETRMLACANTGAASIEQFKSSCGGPGIRIEYSYGMLDYHYDRAGALKAVTTFLFKTSAACETDVYLYGDLSCRAGALEPVTCKP